MVEIILWLTEFALGLWPWSNHLSYVICDFALSFSAMSVSGEVPFLNAK